MKQEIKEELVIPSGINCAIEGNTLICKKGANELSRTIDLPSISIKLEGNKLVVFCKKGSKKELTSIMSFIAHVKNLFEGLDKSYEYTLEAVNVHFPMTLKVDQGWLIINNFLGEKVPRKAKLYPGVKVELKGTKISLSSANKESAGHTAASIEKATKVKGRDRRIFQDGIFITSKPGEDN